MTFDVVGFGALNLDKLFKVNMIAKEEEEGAVLDFKESAGGSAANTVVGLARLELKTGFIGKVASDREGKFLLDEFRREGVNVKGITVSERGRSGTVMGFIDPEGNRALYVDPGVNDQIDFWDINLDYVSGAKFLHLSSFVGEKPFKAQKKLLEQLSGVKISFDPGAIYARKGLTAIKPIIKKCYVMFPNGIEVKQLTGQDYREGARKLTGLGVDLVAVKLGKRGCYVTDGKESHLIEPYTVKVVDTTGAGDAFCAGFLYGLIKRKDLYDCGKLGNFVASRCISMMGARTGLPRLAELKNI
ncbi:MAG TPA: carbohydrate kinase family protein [Candidatus Bathyarchaeota archaeon]|nr:carbohydrate kinase family protein [Candidatus Bathyarchaeota archaeon]